MKFILTILIAAQALCASANSHPGREELLKTIAGLTESIKTQPANPRLHLELGFAYAKLENADEAQKAFETVISYEPNKAIAHFMLGLIYEKKGLKDKAISAWQLCKENSTEQHMKDTAVKHLNRLALVK